MSRVYVLIELGKKRLDIKSDNAFALKLGLKRAHINNWKSGLSKPDVLNVLRLARAAGLTMEEALPYVIEEEELRHCILC